MSEKKKAVFKQVSLSISISVLFFCLAKRMHFNFLLPDVVVAQSMKEKLFRHLTRR
jgi:hypothetical protein